MAPTTPLSSIPSTFHPLLEQQSTAIGELAELALTDLQLLELQRTLVASDYVAEQLARRQGMLSELIASGDLWREYQNREYAKRLAEQLSVIEDEPSLHQCLRQFRQREMVRLIWRDCNRLTDTSGLTAELSALADACIDETLNWLYASCTKRWGVPHSRPDASGQRHPQQMVVLGMGKLGARELNLSSDIDLMFCFPRRGETEGARKCLDNQDFFIRLGQKLIQALDTITVDGFVFRVDMRLRPFGTASPLACSFDAMETYYQEQGRDWERYAMIKARIVAGDKRTGAALLRDLRPFVYRKYIDFSAFESLRDLKAMINREVRRKGLENNVKLGAGGIREVEFICQAFQLIRGGRDNRLQQREVLKILPLLPEAVGMPEVAVQELSHSYCFLRDTEHGIQALQDRQTQELPSEPLALERLAFTLGFASSENFLLQLDSCRAQVSKHFAEVIAPAEADQQEQQATEVWSSLWRDELEPEAAQQLLAEEGFDTPEQALKLIGDLRQSRALQLSQAVARDRLAAVLPPLLDDIAAVENSCQTLERVLLLLKAVLRRSAYLVLLAENPPARQQLVKLCASSAWFAEILSRQPVLLDELISPQTLYSPPDRGQLDIELRQQLLRIPEDDEEQLLEALRYFKQAHLLRVAASEINGTLPLMKVSDYLTWLAETILEAVLDIAWRTLVAKHGVPERVAGESSKMDFIVVGYGKLGGIELSYGSDLDLVFIHDTDSQLTTPGPKPIANSVFFTRLGQRIIHILNTFTTGGQLYEVDMRLRPSGNSGMLVTSLTAFADYQQNEAWTWEHQALVRARPVAGSPAVAERFMAARGALLGASREAETLRGEVVAMRHKMREHLGSSETQAQNQFDLKQDSGGIVDIEFLVQYLVLAHGERYPELYRYTDNIRILDAAQSEGLLAAEECEQLREAYKAFRALGHQQSLQERSSTVEANALEDYRQIVAGLWQREMERE